MSPGPSPQPQPSSMEGSNISSELFSFAPQELNSRMHLGFFKGHMMT